MTSRATAKPYHNGEENRDCAALRAGARQAAAPAGSDETKTRLLARRLREAIAARGTATLDDCTRAGFSKPDAERLYPFAIAKARALDPAIDSMEALP